MKLDESNLVLKVGELPASRRNMFGGRKTSAVTVKMLAFMDAHPGAWCELLSAPVTPRADSVLLARGQKYRDRYEFAVRRADGKVSLWGRTKPVQEDNGDAATVVL